MYSKTIVYKNSYYDSVTLMSLGSKVKKLPGVDQAVVVMATDMNREILENVGLATDETRAAEQNDLVIAVRADGEDIYQQAFDMIQEKLTAGSGESAEQVKVEYKTIRQAKKAFADANVAVISVPGRYAAREARIALNSGMHVMMFSDNVTVEDEKELKELAVSKGLLMMGPDCGTAIINHVGLCFANEIRKGNIGIIGASGTGLQEVLVQIDRLGGGITQALGTGGRDLSREIGGLMMLQAMDALEEDQDTQVVVLVSKPPEKSVEDKIFQKISEMKKPVVVCLLEGDMSRSCREGVYLCDNLLSAAERAVELAGASAKAEDTVTGCTAEQIRKAKAQLKPEQTKVCGLFCGGTLCAEALFILRRRLGKIRSNISHHAEEKIDGKQVCTENLLLDLGDDEFTNGRPHPMIEPSLRDEWVVKAAQRPEVGVILLDFEIGYGSHQDPAGVAVDSIRAARAAAAEQGRELVFVGYICGSKGDKQDLAAQAAVLEAEGVLLARSNKEAANIVADILE